MNGGTTGGGSAAAVTVTTLADLQSALGGTTARVVFLQGTVGSGVATRVAVGSNKTLLGLPGARLVGGLDINNASNVIVRNLIIQGPGAVDVDGVDGVTVSNSRNVWLDHLEVLDGQDGNLDVVNGSEFVTISWCKFRYTAASVNHQFCNLIGNSDTRTSDRGRLTVTFHHNWWAEGVRERMPRVRFGRVHVANNLFTSAGNGHCVRAGIEADLRVENNVFIGVRLPIDLYEGNYTAVTAQGNLFTGTTGNTAGNGTAFTPPYSLPLQAAAEIEAPIRAGAGATLTAFGCGPLPTATRTATRTPTRTASPTATRTSTWTFTRTASPTATRTSTWTFTRTASPTATRTATRTPTRTASPTATRTSTWTPTRTASPTATRSATPTRTATASPTRSATPTTTATPTRTVSPTPSSTATPSRTRTPTATPSATPVPATATSTATGTPSRTSTPTGTPSAAATGTPSRTSTPIGTPSFTPTATPLPATATFTPTASPIRSATATATPTQSSTGTATSTLTPTQDLPSPSATATPTPTGTLTRTASPTLTATPSATSAPSSTATPLPATPTRTPTASPTADPTFTLTPAAPATATPAPQGDGRLVIEAALPWPNPNPQAIAVRLSGPAERLSLKVYTPAWVLVASSQGGPQGAGWGRLPLPAELAQAPAGLYYFVAQAGQGSRVSAPVKGRFYRFLR